MGGAVEISGTGMLMVCDRLGLGEEARASGTGMERFGGATFGDRVADIV